MRWGDWDVIVSPSNSPQPIQEFNPMPCMVRDTPTAPIITMSYGSGVNGVAVAMPSPTESHSTSLNLEGTFTGTSRHQDPQQRILPQQQQHQLGDEPMPLLSCLVPSQVHGSPFRVSIHNWQTLLFNPVMPWSIWASSSPISSYQIQLTIDGVLIDTQFIAAGTVLPLVITTCHSVHTQLRRDYLRWPKFHEERLCQTNGSPGDDWGRIKVVIKSGFILNDQPFLKVKNVVTFAFQHVPLHILQAAGIAWPNEGLLQIPPELLLRSFPGTQSRLGMITTNSIIASDGGDQNSSSRPKTYTPNMSQTSVFAGTHATPGISGTGSVNDVDALLVEIDGLAPEPSQGHAVSQPVGPRGVIINDVARTSCLTIKQEKTPLKPGRRGTITSTASPHTPPNAKSFASPKSTVESNTAIDRLDKPNTTAKQEVPKPKPKPTKKAPVKRKKPVKREDLTEEETEPQPKKAKSRKPDAKKTEQAVVDTTTIVKTASGAKIEQLITAPALTFPTVQNSILGTAIQDGRLIIPTTTATEPTTASNPRIASYTNDITAASSDAIIQASMSIPTSKSDIDVENANVVGTAAALLSLSQGKTV